MTPTARSSNLAALLALAVLLPAGAAWAEAPASPSAITSALSGCADDTASARVAVLRQAPVGDDEADDADDVEVDDLDLDDVTDGEIADDPSEEVTPGEVVYDEDADDESCADEDDVDAGAVITAATSSSLALVRRTGSLSTGSVRLARGGTVTQVVTMRDGGRTLVVARSKRRIGAGGTLKIKAKLNQAGRRAIATASGTVRLKVRTTVAPRGGARKVTIRTVTLRGGS